MEPFTLALVLLAALLHATWNYLAKMIPGGPSFVWLLAAVITVWMGPIVIWYVLTYDFVFTPANIVALLITGGLHLIYFLVLQKGYAVADLSVVYPLARGSGPVFSTLGAVVFLEESLTWVSVGGLALVVCGVLLISGLGHSGADIRKRREGIVYGVGTGLLIAFYTVWDGYSIKQLAVPPLLLEAFSHPIRTIALAPIARKRWPEIARIWREYRWKVVVVALISPLGYLLVLYALKTTPVHVVAPARELSIVVGVILGARLLTEENFRSRLLGALLILFGIVLLAM